MSKYSDNPSLRFNKFIEAKLRGIDQLNGSPDIDKSIIPQSSEYITDTDTDSEFQLPFFIPAGQNPETNTMADADTMTYINLPFAVYSIQQTKIKDEPWLICGSVTHVYYNTGVDKLFEISSYVQDLTDREDWSAQDINYFYSNDETFPFDFKSINFIHGVGPINSKDEGGRDSYMCTIGYDAVYVGNVAPGSWYGNQTSLGMR